MVNGYIIGWLFVNNYDCILKIIFVNYMNEKVIVELIFIKN